MTTAAFPITCQCGHSKRVHSASFQSMQASVGPEVSSERGATVPYDWGYPCTICQCRTFRLDVDDLTPTPPRQTILERAAEIVDNREQQYGSPKENIPRIARLWSEILGIPVTAEQVCLCMILLKIARAVTGTDISEDTITDIAGYARCLERLGETPI